MSAMKSGLPSGLQTADDPAPRGPYLAKVHALTGLSAARVICSIDSGIGQAQFARLAAKVVSGEIVGRRVGRGMIPNSVLTGEWRRNGTIQSATHLFTSEDELRCVHEHSVIRPDLARRGYHCILLKNGKPKRPGLPVPWRSSEWRIGNAETLIVELTREPGFSSLKLVRTFGRDEPVRLQSTFRVVTGNGFPI